MFEHSLQALKGWGNPDRNVVADVAGERVDLLDEDPDRN